MGSTSLPPPPPHAELDCLVLWCSLATIIPSRLQSSQCMCAHVFPKIVPGLAEMCYAILILYFTAASGFLMEKKKKNHHIEGCHQIPHVVLFSLLL